VTGESTTHTVSARLVAVSGPVSGLEIALDEDETSLGRHPSNRIAIADPTVSRNHCLIRRAGMEFHISDLQSENGTLVNGLPIEERQLLHGDRITIGQSQFIFTAERAQPQVALVDDETYAYGQTTKLHSEDALYLKAPVEQALPAAAQNRLAYDLAALVKASSIIARTRNLDDLFQQLLELIFAVTPARRGAVLLLEAEGAEPEHAFTRNQEGPAPVEVSKTIVSQVLNERVSVLNNDVGADEKLRESEAFRHREVHSVLAVPIATPGRVSGLMYLDSGAQKRLFSTADQQLLMTIANQAGLAIENIRHYERLSQEAAMLRGELYARYDMVGTHPKMQALYQFIAKVAPTEATALIRGESGTGKELVARAIHFNSSRRDQPFVAVNCAALTETLLESELFGHEKGAFTGATAQKKGKLEAADGGTVFLDEMGETSAAFQTKLLRVLETREFERVGGTKPIRVDVRFIAATNRDLERAIKEERFRADLFYRLHVVAVTLPPLRERREDIIALAEYFLARDSQKLQKRFRAISKEARACLLAHSWPGNVRELANAVERAVILGDGEVLRAEDLPANIGRESAATSTAAGYHESVRELKRALITSALRETDGNQTEAAKRLGLNPTYLSRLIKNLSVKT
jgi:transcriptional regulator with GAF, ATPase, and Fis domain